MDYNVPILSIFFLLFFLYCTDTFHIEATVQRLDNLTDDIVHNTFEPDLNVKEINIHNTTSQKNRNMKIDGIKKDSNNSWNGHDIKINDW